MTDAIPGQMHEKHVTKRKTADHPIARCAQCAEVLDAKRIEVLATRAETVMCRDCAYDAMPCTD